MTSIPVHPIARPDFSDDDLFYIKQCLESYWATQGPLVSSFEEKIKERHQASYALATTSCTAALHLSTMALDLSPGDEVIVPAFTWITSAHCVEYVGAKVVFADIDPFTFNLCPKSLEKAITPRTKAVVVVHLFGLSAPMDDILAITHPRGIKIIEDAACAIGTTYKGRPVGAIGDLGCFSFHPRKVITTGEGGMVLTHQKTLATKIAALRNHGATGLPPEDPKAERPYTMSHFEVLGYNLRLCDIQAGLGLSQFKKLDRILEHRKKCALYYTEKLKDTAELILPTDPCGGHTYQSYVIRLASGEKKKRNALMDFLKEKGIQTRPGTHAVHRLGYYAKKYHIEPDAFPYASLCEDTTITLPIYPSMTERDQDAIVKTMRDGIGL